jgi:hypothetical protein
MDFDITRHSTAFGASLFDRRKIDATQKRKRDWFLSAGTAQVHFRDRCNGHLSLAREVTEMWTKLFAVGVLAAALGIAPAMAQEAPSEQQPPAATDSEGQPPPAATESYQPEAQSSEMGDLTGWPVYSSDGAKLGEVTSVKQGADGIVEAIHTDIGGFLGIGAKTVEISADQFSKGDNRLDLSMTADEANELPEAAKQ